jgi:hypothetical protein
MKEKETTSMHVHHKRHIILVTTPFPKSNYFYRGRPPKQVAQAQASANVDEKDNSSDDPQSVHLSYIVIHTLTG